MLSKQYVEVMTSYISARLFRINHKANLKEIRANLLECFHNIVQMFILIKTSRLLDNDYDGGFVKPKAPNLIYCKKNQ